MLAFPPTNLGCTFDTPTFNYNDLHTQDFNSHYLPIDEQLEFPFESSTLTQPYVGSEQLSPSGISNGYTPKIETVVKEKKLNHNASERNRRKRINSLYTSLRALLPFADQTKKLSVPCTIAKVLNYIPELQSEVEGLIQRKGGLLPNAMTTTTSSPSLTTSSCSVRATQLGNGEISIQIAAIKSIQTFFMTSEILQELEEEGVVVIDVSSSESASGRVFCHIHIVVEAKHDIKCEVLKEKLLCLCEEWEKLSRWIN